jgi:hypothetical protein
MNPATPPARAAHCFRHALIVLLLAAFLLHLPLLSGRQEKPGRERPPNRTARSTPETTAVFVRFTDDRIMKLGMGKEHILLNTPYGKLLIPIANIRSIDFATRIADADARRANAAVANFSSRQFRVRRAAEAELLNLRQKAAPALHQALRSNDVEVVLRAKTLLSRLSQRVAEDQLEIRAQDVVRTAGSRIAGRIEGTGLKAYPILLDKGPRKLLPLMGLRSLAVGGDPRAINAAPDPGNLQAFQERIGKTFWFKVTGAVGVHVGLPSGEGGGSRRRPQGRANGRGPGEDRCVTGFLRGVNSKRGYKRRLWGLAGRLPGRPVNRVHRTVVRGHGAKARLEV